jgi:hypothetical protein
VKTTTAVAVLGSIAINLMLALLITAASATPTARADEVAQCPRGHVEGVIGRPAPEHTPAGGHLVAVRMGWEAG